MPPLHGAVLAPLTRRFQQAIVGIGERTTPAVQKTWADLPTYNDDQVDIFATRSARALTTAKFAAVRHAVGYYSLAAGVRPRAIDPEAVTVVADTRQPFIDVWTALKRGVDLVAAIEIGHNTIDAMTRDMVTSSSRQTGDLVVQSAGLRVIGWERIPEADACPWCLEVADGAIFTSAESADFGHDRCGCSAQPIYAA